MSYEYAYQKETVDFMVATTRQSLNALYRFAQVSLANGNDYNNKREALLCLDEAWRKISDFTLLAEAANSRETPRGENYNRTQKIEQREKSLGTDICEVYRP